LGAIEPQARFFSRNRGFALLVRKGNPLGIHGLVDVARSGGRIALPEAASEPQARARYRAAVDDLIGKPAADALLAAEAPNFPGRIGIVHRDLPEMVARGYADVALTQYHLISYWTRIFPNHFALVPVSGAERFFVKIAFGRAVDPLRPRARMAFEEFFFSRARDSTILSGVKSAMVKPCCSIGLTSSSMSRWAGGSGPVPRRADGQPLGRVLIGPVNTALIGLAEESSLPLRIMRPMARACRSPLITSGTRSRTAAIDSIRRSCCLSQPGCQ